MVKARLSGIILSLMKAFFNSTFQIAWGIAGFILLTGLMNSYKMETTAIEGLFKIAEHLIDYWGYYFTAFFLYDFMMDYIKWANSEIIIKKRVK